MKPHNDARDVVLALPRHRLVNEMLCCCVRVLDRLDGVDRFLVRHDLQKFRADKENV